MSLRRRVIMGLAAGGAAMALALPASAQAWGSANWRQRHPPESTPGKHPITSFTFELRFGGYYPKIDEAFSPDPGYSCGGPYKCFFGDSVKFYFGLELDWLPLRIPYVGKIGPAFGWGIVTFGGKGHSLTSNEWGKNWQDTNGAVSGTTGLTIMPMHVSAALRIDEISRRTVVPVVPYAKLGLGFGTWTARNDSGTSKLNPDADDEQAGESMSFGPHIGLGAMLGLNFLDSRSGSMARENSGIKQAYIYGEWMYDDLQYGLKAPAMRIGSSSWVLGLALDF